MAVVLLLPLVPVTHSTRSRGASWSHRPRPPTTGMPRASSCRRSSRYRLMPGDLITTSQLARAARPSPEVASTARPSTPPAGGWSSTSTGWRPSEVSAARLARPSTPRPQRPTWPPASPPRSWPAGPARRSDQEIVGRIGIRDEVAAERAEQLGRGGQLGQAVQLRGQDLEELGAGPVGPLRGEQRRGPALADLAHALERLAGGGGAEQGTELVGQPGAGVSTAAGVRARTVVAV